VSVCDVCVVILAGGTASRFGGVMQVLPKCFLPVSAEETLLTRLLSQLREAGFAKTVISTSPQWFPLFEAFTRKIVDGVRANDKLWESTVILVTVDEGGGYYDSGYVQPVDFFGDGTRIPLIVVSKYSVGGRVAHEYSDHASIVKFIERNWHLPKLSTLTRDNLPNPKTSRENRYVPQNSPAIGDLWGNFAFRDHDDDGQH